MLYTKVYIGPDILSSSPVAQVPGVLLKAPVTKAGCFFIWGGGGGGGFKTDITHDRVIGILVNIPIPKHSVLRCVLFV